VFKTKVLDKIGTHLISRILLPENCAVYEIMWKNMVERGTPQMAV